MKDTAARRKRKASPDARAAYTSIQSALTRIKPKLHDKHPECSSLRADLLQLAEHVHLFSTHCPRAMKAEWSHRSDELDGEGVALWNASLVQRDIPDDTYRAVCAALRLAGFRLIEAGMEQKPTIDSLIHVLQLASKVGASLADVGESNLAAGILSSAAKYEEALRATEDPQGEHAQSRARAVMLYYTSRMEAAWREGNTGVAEFMLEKFTEKDQYFALLTPSDRRTLAGKLLAIGKGVLKTTMPKDRTGESTQDSIKWIQRAFAIVEPLNDTTDPGKGQLRRSILRTLSRAYFLASSQDPENLARAEAALQELIDTVDTSLDHTSAEYQQLRWMRVAILKRRGATHAHLLEAFQSIIDHMEFSERNISDILQELRSLGHDHALVTAIHLYCVQQGLEPRNSSGLIYLDRLLLSLIFHTSKDREHARALQNIAHSLDLLDNKAFELPRISTTACLTLFWQFGDRLYQARRWSEAADWFLVGTHRVFASMSQCDEHAQASAIIRRCPTSDAATHYVALLVAAHQGLEDEAVASVDEMVHASNFNKKMLLLATRLANQTGMKALLLSVLQALLEASIRDGVDSQAEAVALIRCIIRLVLRTMSEPAADLTTFIPMVIRHFSTALSLVTALHSKPDTTVCVRDISWLWRTAYNTAVQGCTDWENHEDGVSDLFDIARQLLESYMKFPAVDAEIGHHVYLINASFASAAGRVFACRHRVPKSTAQEVECRQRIAKEITESKDRIQKVLGMVDVLTEEDFQRAHSFLNILLVFEAEIACQNKSWGRISEVINERTRLQDVDLGSFEAITDLLWVEKDCPTEVLLAALEAILHASLDRSALSVDKFSRWLRAICTILLSRNSTADRVKALGYVEQAVGVLQEHGGEGDPQAYPMDERHWLMGTVYNTGIECLHMSSLDEAKRWFEAAATICRYIPDGEARAERVSKTYASLLARYRG